MKEIIIKISTCFILLTICFFTGCDQLYNAENSDFFYIRNDESYMPVWVCGNKESNTFVILIHGGPGGSAQIYHNIVYNNTMEEDFAWVYWDQRAAGSSHGNSGEEYFTLEQFVEDTDKIVDTIRLKYNDPSIILMGHSWGGCLGTAYLLDSERQAKINCWIELDGAHDMISVEALSSQFVIDYANEQLSKENTNKPEWQKILDWYQKNPQINIDNLIEHSHNVRKAYGYTPENQTVSIDYLSCIFNSPFNYLQTMMNNLYTTQNFDVSQINLVTDMNKITIPSLIIWGALDGRCPVPLAQQAYNALGTPEADKSIVLLPNSGHEPVDKDIDLFQDSVRNFIKVYGGL